MTITSEQFRRPWLSAGIEARARGARARRPCVGRGGSHGSANTERLAILVANN